MCVPPPPWPPKSYILPSKMTYINDSVDEIENPVISYSENLIYVDSRDILELIHLTMRELC